MEVFVNRDGSIFLEKRKSRDVECRIILEIKGKIRRDAFEVYQKPVRKKVNFVIVLFLTPI